MGEEDLDCDARAVFVIALLLSDTLLSFALFSVCFCCAGVFFGREDRGGAVGQCLRVFIVYVGAEALTELNTSYDIYSYTHHLKLCQQRSRLQLMTKKHSFWWDLQKHGIGFRI